MKKILSFTTFYFFLNESFHNSPNVYFMIYLFLIKVLAKAPFQPKPSEKPLAEVGNFMLNSERRAREREAFELKLKQKEAEMEGAKRELEARKKREQEEEVARLRKEAVLRAQPIRSDFIFF